MIPTIPLTSAGGDGAIAATLIGIIGYRFIHRINKIGAGDGLSALLVGLMMLTQRLASRLRQQGSFGLNGWFATTICAVWQMSFSIPRLFTLLPENIGVFKPFICTGLGACCGTVTSLSGGGRGD